MTCQHKKTTVLNSRKPDSVRCDGKPWFGKRDFNVYTFRRRKCVDCGFLVTTVEVALDLMDELHLATDAMAIKAKIADDIRRFLLSYDCTEQSPEVEP